MEKQITKSVKIGKQYRNVHTGNTLLVVADEEFHYGNPEFSHRVMVIGSGKLIAYDQFLQHYESVDKPTCPTCGGTGRVTDSFTPLPWRDCPDCGKDKV